MPKSKHQVKRVQLPVQNHSNAMADDQGLGQEQYDIQQAQLIAYRGQVNSPFEDEGGGDVRASVVRQYAQDISDGESIFVHPRVTCWSPRVVHGQCGSHVQVRVGGEGDQQNKDPQQEG